MQTNQQNLTEKIKNTLSLDNNWDNLHPSDPNYMMYSPKPVGYNSIQEHNYLMQNLLIGYNAESILDIGCGRCDLYGLIQELFGQPMNYHGIDHNPIMTDLAKQKWNLTDVQTGAYQSADLPNCDWVIASGIFTERRCETEDEDLQKVFEDIDILYNKATKVVSFNLLNPINTKHHEGFLYIHPGLMLDMLIEKYKHVTLRANYSNDVYSILIYKF